MKRTWMILFPVLTLCAAGHAENGGPGSKAGPLTSVNVDNQVATNQNQSASASGGDSQSDSASNSVANVNLSTSSRTNYETRTPPLTTFPPYLPYWNHGGWGTIKAYFPNGPTANDLIYETTFDPANPSDMRELRSVLKALPHKGLLEAAGGILNDVAVVLFGKPDTYFHGRGLEIADSVVRDCRPEGKALLVFIDSNVDVGLLGEEGYAYMGKVSVEGDPDRNWDQAYKAAVSEALLWDVDILLISGGMKGVTTGTNFTFPSAAAGYSQVNYSLSLLGSKASGITEGKGKAVLSAEAYRYCPQTVERRRIPEEIYERIRARPQPSAAWMMPTGSEIGEPVVNWERASAAAVLPTRASAAASGSAPAATTASAPAASAQAPAAAAKPRALSAPQYAASAPARITAAPARRTAPPRPAYERPGITMSRELFELAGFPNDQQVGYVNIR
jgi:hypothetical protein